MICPNCKEEIQGLDCYQTGTHIEWVYINNIDGLTYEDNEFVSDDSNSEYQCPMCHTILCTDDEEVYDLLKGVKAE